MKTRLTTKILALVIAIVAIFSIGGVAANWVYYDVAQSAENEIYAKLEPFNYTPGTGDVVSGEVAVTNNFVDELNDDSSEIHNIIQERKDQGYSWATIREIAGDDPNATGLKELLGLDEYTDLTIVIKFLSGTPAYELYTTRVDLDARDESGNYIIPASAFTQENMYIYPVNKTTFEVDAEGNYSAKEVTVGYSRPIYYYETPFQQNTSVRSFDVVLWAEGKDSSTAVTIETALVNVDGGITVQNIDKQKEIWFAFTPNATANYTVASNTDGATISVLNANQNAVSGNGTYRLTRNNTYYIKIVYSTEGIAEDINFSITN